jgi:G protein beta subunit-like protein
VWDAVFSADSDYLVSASSDQTARLWALDQAQTIQHYSGHHKAVTAVAMHDKPPET